MTLKRIGAVLLAVALVGGALLLRRTVLDDDADVAASDTTGTPEPDRPAAELRCVTELRPVCAALGAEHPDLRIAVEDAGTTLDELAALPDDAARPLWLTIQPYPAMLDELRAANRLAPFAATVEAVGASQLAIATPTDRTDVLLTACAGQPLWRCIGDAAGDPWTELGGESAWGLVRPSLGDVDQQAVALASFASAVAGYFGRADVVSSDWQGDPAFTPWLRRLAGTVSTSQLSAGTPLATMAVRPPLDIAATTDVEFAALGGGRFAVNYPEPSMWVEAVLALPDGTSPPGDLVSTLMSSLGAAGWDGPAAAVQGLPSATTMLGLRALWAEST